MIYVTYIYTHSRLLAAPREDVERAAIDSIFDCLPLQHLHMDQMGVSLCVRVCVSVRMCMYVCVCVCMYLCMYVCRCMNICMYVCRYVYTYIIYTYGIYVQASQWARTWPHQCQAWICPYHPSRPPTVPPPWPTTTLRTHRTHSRRRRRRADRGAGRRMAVVWFGDTAVTVCRATPLARFARLAAAQHKQA